MATGSDEDEDSTSKCCKHCPYPRSNDDQNCCRRCCSIGLHTFIVLMMAAIMLTTTAALFWIGILKVKNEDEHTTSYLIRWSVFFFLPPVLALIIAVIVAIVGFCRHKTDRDKICGTPNKLVRLIFPYIKRKGNKNVMFGFILTKYHNWVLLWVAIEVVFYTMWVFWFNIMLIYRNNSNPHAVYSYELNCYYLNYTEIELSTAERLTTKEAIKCFAINSDIAGAMDRATNILAFTWILVSILTWVLLNINYCVMKRFDITQSEQSEHTCSTCSLFYYIVIHIVHLSIDIAWIAIIVNYNDKKWYSFIATPENNLVIAVLLGSISVIGFPIKKAPKSLEEPTTQEDTTENTTENTTEDTTENTITMQEKKLNIQDTV